MNDEFSRLFMLGERLVWPAATVQRLTIGHVVLGKLLTQALRLKSRHPKIRRFVLRDTRVQLTDEITNRSAFVHKLACSITLIFCESLLKTLQMIGLKDMTKNIDTFAAVGIEKLCEFTLSD